MILTRYAMPGLEIGYEFANRSPFSSAGLFQPLPDPFFGVRAGRDVQKALLGFGILYNSGCLSLHCQDKRALALPQMLHEIARAAAEGGQRMDIFGDVEHG